MFLFFHVVYRMKEQIEILTVKTMAKMNAGEDGSSTVAPINVEVITPGRVPKTLPKMYFGNGILIIPK